MKSSHSWYIESAVLMNGITIITKKSTDFRFRIDWEPMTAASLTE